MLCDLRRVETSGGGNFAGLDVSESPAVPRPSLALAALLGAACAHTASARSEAPASWIDDALTGERPGEIEDLRALAEAGPRGRVVRLDRLLDLFDAARFGADEGARETLWTALGGHATGVGERATRDAQTRLLAEAMALDAALPQGSENGAQAELEADRRLVADAIMLLTTDLEPPGNAEDLVVRTLAYRTLVERGHPRIADNARWRIYDHVRGTLFGATEAPPDTRLDVAVQALYAERESVEDLLADSAPHARPAWPSIGDLWAPLGEQARALAEDPRWEAVLKSRSAADATLRDTLAAALPASRDQDWPLVRLAAGTAKAESFAPIVRVDRGGSVIVDDGRPGARTLPLEDGGVDAIADAIRAALAADGRGAVLLVADPATPAPRVHALMRAIRRASVDRVELAVHEPRLDAKATPAVLALGLLVARDGDKGTAESAARAARIHVHLHGRGPAFGLDGVALREPAQGGAALERRLDDIAAAYPSERMVRLTLDPDVQLQQLVELLAALEGGPARRFAAVAWQPGAGPPPSATAKASPDATLAARAAIGRTAFGFTLERPFPLVAHDDARLVELVEQFSVCLPELGAKLPEGGLTLSLPFSEGGLGPVMLGKPGKPGKLAAPPQAQADFKACIDSRASTFRLRRHRDTMTIAVTIRPTGKAG
jgi:biopolymer transport protein ExbD